VIAQPAGNGDQRAGLGQGFAMATDEPADRIDRREGVLHDRQQPLKVYKLSQRRQVLRCGVKDCGCRCGAISHARRGRQVLRCGLHRHSPVVERLAEPLPAIAVVIGLGRVREENFRVCVLLDVREDSGATVLPNPPLTF
jgi:hypothetical protein